jgi:hypothetical protein
MKKSPKQKLVGKPSFILSQVKSHMLLFLISKKELSYSAEALSKLAKMSSSSPKSGRCWFLRT